MAAASIRVLMVDDHALFLDLLGAGLESSPGFEVVGRAETVPEAERLLDAHCVDVITLDMKLDNESGLDFLKYCTEAYPQVRVLCLTMMEHELYMSKAREAGAAGYFFKGGDFGALREAIREVHGGKVVFPQAATAERGVTSHKGKELSDRELSVLQLLTQGLLIKEIAVELDISENSVSTYISRSMGKLGVSSRAELLRLAMEVGLV